MLMMESTCASTSRRVAQNLANDVQPPRQLPESKTHVLVCGFNSLNI